MMPASTDSLQRREAISRLLQSGPVPNQQDLVDALQRMDFEATQSSVSRDLRSLGAIKTARGYELPTQDISPRFAEVAGFVRGMRAAGANMLVLKTAVGAAQRVALALDHSDWPEIVGTIGGDDTVFIATESAQAQRNISARLSHIADSTQSQESM